jgi:hypothetical protein
MLAARAPRTEAPAVLPRPQPEPESIEESNDYNALGMTELGEDDARELDAAQEDAGEPEPKREPWELAVEAAMLGAREAASLPALRKVYDAWMRRRAGVPDENLAESVDATLVAARHDLKAAAAASATP